jgi:hypothetical protein
LVLWAIHCKPWSGLFRWLVNSIWFLLSIGKVAIRPEVTHCQFIQDGQIRCFHQAAAALPYSCNSGWSAPPPARRGNSVLSTTLSPRRLTQGSTMALLWEVSSPPMLSTFVTFSAFIHWEFGSLFHSVLQGKVQHSIPSSLLVLDLQFTIYVFQCCWWVGFQSAQGLCWIMFPEGR